MPASKEELLAYIQNLRLTESKHINDEKISKNAHDAEGNKTFKGFLKNTGHAFVRTFTDYDEKAKKIESQIEKFDQDHPSVINYDTAKETIESIFREDEYQLISLVFAASVIYDDQYKYEYKEQTLNAVSKLLYDDEDKLITLKQAIDNIYSEISGANELDDDASQILGTTALFGAIGFIISGGLSAVAGVAVDILVLAGMIAGFATSVKISHDANQIRKVSPQENALNLTLQLIFIRSLKDKMSEDQFKEKLDSILKELSATKSDLDYYLFVEHEDVTNNGEKMKQFHRFENLLYKRTFAK